MLTDFSLIQKLCIWAIPVLLAITVHEAAHGYVASKCGDPTAKMLGRVTLNPLKHIDPIGTVVVPLVLFFLGGFIIGWAKPVPIDARNLRSPKRDMAFVAAAGPLSNLVMAILWAILARIGQSIGFNAPNLAVIMIAMGFAGIAINLILMLINFIPIPPLDGSRIVSSLLPNHMAYAYNKIERFGFIILIFLLVSGILSYAISPLYSAFLSVISSALGLHY